MKKRLAPGCLALVLCLVLTALVSAPAALAGEAETAPDIGLTAEEAEFAALRGTVRVGYVQDRPPVSFTDEDGELAGMSRYIFDEVARQDLEFSTDENLSVAVSSGSQTLRKVLHAAYPRFELVDYDTIPDCFDAVLSGESGLMILNQYVVEYWFSKPACEVLKVIPVMGLDEELCFSAIVTIDGDGGMSQSDGEKLIAVIDKAIASILEDFTGGVIIKSAMENQYRLTFGDFARRCRAALIVLALSAVDIIALAILLFWQRMRSAEARAEASAKGRFLSSMSHEIRTPLNGLIGLNYLMEQKLDDREKLEKYLQQSTSTARYLLRLVTDILDMSMLQGQGVEPVTGPVDLNALVSTLRTLAQPGMAEKGLEFAVTCDLTAPYVEGDGDRIEQVALSLLDNARKFTPQVGRVEPTVSQESADGDTAQTSFAVSDTGRGMSEEFKEKIFSAFSREPGTVSKCNQGTGLGLAISHELARLMGGKLTFESERDVGSTFLFTFPGKILPVPEEPRQEAPEAAARRVMVAEDNELNLEIMLELLEEEHFETVSAGDGREALEAFERSEPGSIQIILMDLLMPNMDGYESARAIRALPREDAKTVRIIACSANTFEEDRRRAFEAGMDGFIPKPVDVGDLLEMLSQ